MADNGKKISQNQIRINAKQAKQLKDEAIWERDEEFNSNTENFEYVEIPETDLFDKPFGSVSINLIDYGPGKHFVRPDIAKEIRDLLALRLQGDMRVLRPTKDKKMLEIMARNGKPLTSAEVS